MTSSLYTSIKYIFVFLPKAIYLIVDIMKINIVEDEPKSLMIEFEDADRGVPELIKNELLKNKDVEFAAVAKEHPETSWPRLIVKSSKSARSLVLKAIESVQEQVDELEAKLHKK